jgi:hypothetical protein
MRTFISNFLESATLSFDDNQNWNWTPQGNILAMAMTPGTTACGRTRGDRSGEDWNWDDARPD